MKKTDWDHYYNQPYKTASLTRPIIIKRIINYIKKYRSSDKPFTITEFGGGNSCIYESIQQAFNPAKYYIVDNNQTGLDAFSKRFGKQENTLLLNRDILALEKSWQSDIVFSIGLIEHFSPEDTRKAVIAHLEVLKEGGLLILGFPTPTFLYRITRKLSELLGMWIFHDERPLKAKEVQETIKPYGDVLSNEIIWSVILTQAYLILKKH
jgi:Methyltransferase domain